MFSHESLLSDCRKTLILRIAVTKVQGELEGAKPASNEIKCPEIPCTARVEESGARIFALRDRAKIRHFQAVKKAR